ncbi:uncharacterized protein [Watersipora subatra]|uniref:uncharacterized protein n=1 Tax=Watersipora subatra TaxID=2589382 RepID=UPI00355B6C97
MDAQFQSFPDEDGRDSIEIGMNNSKRMYDRFNRTSRVFTVDRVRFTLLFLLAASALVISIVSLTKGSAYGSYWSPQETPQSSGQEQILAVGSLYCGGDDAFKPLMNAYVKEGIIGTPNSQLMSNTSGYLQCYKACIKAYGENCSFYSYNSMGGPCTISSADFYSTWTLAEEVDGAITCFKYRTANRWKTMYKRPKLTKSGYNNEVTGPWIDNDYFTNGSLHAHGDELASSSSWTILKSQLCRYWNDLNVDKVKVSLYKDGREVHQLIFNGRGSNIESWFHDAFLLETTWTDLSPANPPLYIGWWYKDYARELTDRAMYVASRHNGCPDDKLWMVIIQNQKDIVCDWETIGEQNVPRLFYAPNKMEAGITELDEADYMVISISFPLILEENLSDRILTDI